MIGNKRNVMFGIMAAVGGLTLAILFGLMAISNYFSPTPTPSPAMAVFWIVLCVFFLWRAVRSVAYVVRQRPTTEVE